MLPPQFLVPARIERDVSITSKKRLLELLARRLADADPALHFDKVFDRLLERERLGSTGLGHGVALPHARMKGLREAIGAFVQLRTGVDFDAIDQKPVDLALAMLVPESATEAHLQLLAQLAARFDEERLRTQLRNAKSAEEILQLLSGSHA